MFSTHTAENSSLLFSEQSQNQGGVQEDRHRVGLQYRLWARAVGSPLVGERVQRSRKISRFSGSSIQTSPTTSQDLILFLP